MTDPFPPLHEGGDIPLLDGPPDLSMDESGDYQMPGATVPHVDRPWKLSRDADARLVQRVFNRFRIEKLGTGTWWEARFADPPVVRQRRLADGTCQTERKALTEEHTGHTVVVLVWVETYVVDENLEEYYSWTAGAPAAAGDGAALAAGFAGAHIQAVGVAAAESAAGSLAMLEGASVAAVGVGVQAGAVAAGAFFTTSAIMSNIALPASSKSSEGWYVVGKFHEAKRRTPTPVEESWVEVGPPHPCDPDVSIVELPAAVSLRPPEPVVREREERFFPPDRPAGEPAAEPDRGDARPSGVSGVWDLMRRFWWVLVAVAVLVILVAFLAGGGSDPGIAAPSSTTVGTSAPPTTSMPSTTAAPSTTEPAAPPSTTSTTTSSSTTTTRAATVVPAGFEALAGILSAAGVPDASIAGVLAASIADAIGDFIYSQSATAPGNGGPDVDIAATVAFALDVTQAAVDGLFNDSVFECGGSDPITVCADAPLEFPPGEMVVVAAVLDGPAGAGEWTYTYAAVFDGDGDPANDFQASPAFDWDYFQGTDQWYVLDKQDGWSLGRYDGSFAGPPVPTAARVVIDGDTIVWFIPMSEFAGDPAVRVTAFRHDGSFSPQASGGDVGGADPTEPPLPPVPIGG